MGSVLVYAVAPFTDVEEHVYEEGILYVEETGLVDGYEDGRFAPDETINRVEFTKIIVRATIQIEGGYEAMGDTLVDGFELNDVTDGSWYMPYVNTALQYGLISGYPDGTFKPGDDINFVEAAKIIATAYGLATQPGENVWFESYVQALTDARAIPTTIGSFDHLLTRGEMAEMIYRVSAGITTLPSQGYYGLSSGLYDDELLTMASINMPVYLEYTEELYNDYLGEQPVVLFFHSGWCPLCRQLSNYIDENLASFHEGAVFLEVDFDEEQTLRQEYGVTLQSTFVVLDSEGEVVDTLFTNDVSLLREAINASF